MGASEQLLLNGLTHWEPVLGLNGEWGTVAGMAVRESLSRGSLDGVMDVLGEMDGRAMADVLQEAGFPVAESAVERGREAVLVSVQKDLIEAVNRRVDGFELHSERGMEAAADFAAKDAGDGFKGNRDAVRAVQRVLSSNEITVDLFGDVRVSERNSLLCIAGQALQAGVQGFGFDGVPGKFGVPCSMREVATLHEAAASAVAVEMVREAVDVWRTGGKVGEMSRWVPDSVQRVLQGAIAENAAHTLIRAVDDGVVARFAAEAGLHEFTQTLAKQGLDLNAPTIDAQAEMLGITVATPDRERGKYVGPVVGVDHRAGLVKYSRSNGIEVPFTSLPKEQDRLQLGDRVRVDYNKGVAQVKVAARESRDVGR